MKRAIIISWLNFFEDCNPKRFINFFDVIGFLAYRPTHCQVGVSSHSTVEATSRSPIQRC